jgi:serine O-acetyltransferase
MRLTRALVYSRRLPVLTAIAGFWLRLLGADIPRGVEIGQEFNLHHHGLAVVIHPKTRIGDRVSIFQQVTIGRADIVDMDSPFEGVVIEDDVILGAGCKVLGPPEGLTVGRGTVVGANAVLLESTRPWEVWGGVPARRIGDRRPAAVGGSSRR